MHSLYMRNFDLFYNKKYKKGRPFQSHFNKTLIPMVQFVLLSSQRTAKINPEKYI